MTAIVSVVLGLRGPGNAEGLMVVGLIDTPKVALMRVLGVGSKGSNIPYLGVPSWDPLAKAFCLDLWSSPSADPF